VVSVVWVYNGLSAQEVEERIIYNHERMISTLVVTSIYGIHGLTARELSAFPARRLGLGCRGVPHSGQTVLVFASSPRHSSSATTPPRSQSSSTAWPARNSRSRNCRTWR
jgi:hypothetical protein